jgi:hypothetical protein
VLSLGEAKTKRENDIKFEKNKFLAKRGLARKLYNNHPEEVIVAVTFHNSGKTDWNVGWSIDCNEVSWTFLGLPVWQPKP